LVVLVKWAICKITLYRSGKTALITGCGTLPRGGLPPGAGIGLVHDWLRQRQHKTEKEKKRKKKLRKKIERLSKRRKRDRPEESKKIMEAIENVKKHLEKENRRFKVFK